MSARPVAVLGAGMHPWGKWGKNFVEYGVAAARAALKDAGIAWKDVQFVAGGETIRNGYPGFIAGATFARSSGGPACACRRATPRAHPVPPRFIKRARRFSPGTATSRS